MTKVAILAYPYRARRSLLLCHNWGETRPGQNGWGSVGRLHGTVIGGRGEHTDHRTQSAPRVFFHCSISSAPAFGRESHTAWRMTSKTTGTS